MIAKVRLQREILIYLYPLQANGKGHLLDEPSHLEFEAVRHRHFADGGTGIASDNSVSTALFVTSLCRLRYPIVPDGICLTLVSACKRVGPGGIGSLRR